MTFPVTCDVAPPDQQRSRPSALILLSRLLLVVGGMVVFGIFAIMLAGNASAAGARTVSTTVPSLVDDSSTPQSTAPSLVEGVVHLIAPLIPTVHVIATSAAPVVKPVLMPVSVALAPSLHIVSALVAPVTRPVLVQPVTADLGLAPALSAIGGSSTSVRTGSIVPMATSDTGAASVGPVAPTGTSVNAVGIGFIPAPRPGQTPGWPAQSSPAAFGVSASTSSVGSAGGHSPSFGTADSAAMLLAHVSGRTLFGVGVLTPQAGYVHGRDHPS